MNAEQLSARLTKVSEYIRANARLVDVGSDHAYLPVYCIEKGLASFAIASEVTKGPFHNAIATVKESGISECTISVRLGNGLEVIEQGEVDCVTICGMGGGLIVSILQAGIHQLNGDERLILQPNRGEELVRQWLFQNDWRLLAEEILEEDGKIYEILVAEKGRMESLTEVERLLGPFLLKKQSGIFRKKWLQEKERVEAALTQLKEAQSSLENQERRMILEKKWTIIEKGVVGK